MSDEVRRALKSLIEKGFQVRPEALEILNQEDHPELVAQVIVEKLSRSESKPLFIDAHEVEDAKAEVSKILHNRVKLEPSCEPKARSATPAKEVEAEIEVLYSPREVSVTSDIESFRSYFLSRFRKLRRLLLERADVRGAVSISEALGSQGKRVKTIGIVASKREMKSGNLSIEVEDEGAAIRAIFMRNDDKSWRKGLRVMPDEVVCVDGVVRGNFILVKDVIWPDLPAEGRGSSYKLGNEPLYAVLISDTHIGSKAFLERHFRHFINWIKGDAKLGSEVQPYVKYLLIAGDLVDGVGVYPDQAEELLIPDLGKQYSMAQRFLSQIPDHIEIIIIPGNHDAAGVTIPSPPIFKSYAEELYSMSNVHMLGDPSYVSLHGVTFLISHGKSLDDVIPLLPDCSFDHPEKAMVELLRSRHLAPVYGDKTPIAPLPYDPLVIERVPDVMQAGHVHVHGVANYRGVVVANSGAWQSQTSYQRSMGLVPRPAIIPVINLSNCKCTLLDFTSQ